MKIKVCGMKYRDNIKAVSGLLPDFMGFIFWQGSPRFFDSELPEMPPSVKKVGVFVNAPESEILEKVARYQLDYVQLHGSESAECCATLRQNGVAVIKAFSVDADFDFSRLSRFDACCDFFLFDTKGTAPGGNGVPFDWRLLGRYRCAKPIFLSGGIHPESARALKNLNFPIYAVDINSRFEKAPGSKNVDAIAQFKQQLR